MATRPSAAWNQIILGLLIAAGSLWALKDLSEPNECAVCSRRLRRLFVNPFAVIPAFARMTQFEDFLNSAGDALCNVFLTGCFHKAPVKAR